MNVLDLFSGIGGFSYGLHSLGSFNTVAFCEMDKDCQRVLNKNFPGVKIFEDVRELKYGSIGDKYVLYSSKEEIVLDKPILTICGGFPCQDISIGGKRKGISGERSGLWKEFWRLINEIKPKYVIIENVEQLRKNGLGVVLNDLHKIGYDAEWHCITAESVGLPHQRDRLFLIAYPSGQRQYEYTGEEGHLQAHEEWQGQEIYPDREERQLEFIPIRPILSSGFFDFARSSNAGRSAALPEVRRVVNGVPGGLDESLRKKRIKQLGNSIVPQIASIFGLAILEMESKNEKI